MPDKAKLHDILDEFLKTRAPKDQPQLISALEAMLSFLPAFSRPQKSDLASTLDERYHYALKIEEKIVVIPILGGQIDAAFVTIIMLLPITTLRKGGWLDYTTQKPRELYVKLSTISNLVKHFLLKNRNAIPDLEKPSTKQSDTPQKRALTERESRRPKRHTSGGVKYYESFDEPEAGSSRSRKTDEKSDPSYAQDPVDRKDKEKDKCRLRDAFQCVLLHTAKGQVTHIIPFSWNNDEKAIKTTSSVCLGWEPFFSEQVCVDLEKLLANPAEPGSSDRVWNMLYMNSQLHDWWSRAFFGLYCLGIRPHDQQPDDSNNAKDPEENAKEALWDVDVQFNWLPRRWGKPVDKITLKGEDNGFKEMAKNVIEHQRNGSPALNHPSGGRIAAFRVDTHQPILSGHQFTLTMPLDDAMKCKMMLDLQWALIQIGAVSGGAEYPELLPDHPDWDEE